jgi:hypothetical protein
MRSPATTTVQSTPPPILDVPFVHGIHAGDGLVHAIPHDFATWAVQNGDDGWRLHTGACCGASVEIARAWGEFRRGTEWTDRYNEVGQLCPHCCWAVALDLKTTEAELAAITPTGPELSALTRLLPGGPTPAVDVCQQVLARRGCDDERDPDSECWAQILGTITAHRPELLVDEVCGEGSCDHDDDKNRCYAGSVVACAACSIRAGSWAGEWEGQYECTVAAPCSALLAMAAKYGTKVA